MPDKHNNQAGITIPGRRQRILNICALLALQTLLPACAESGGDTSTGRTLFEGQCRQCHRGGAATLKTPAAKVPMLLRDGTVRAHRFHLDDTQLRDLAAYLTEVKAGGG